MPAGDADGPVAVDEDVDGTRHGTTPPVRALSPRAASRASSAPSVASTPRPPAPAPARPSTSEALPRTTVGAWSSSSRAIRVRNSSPPTATGSSTQGRPCSRADPAARDMACAFVSSRVPTLTRTAEASAANAAASCTLSTIAGAAPTASRALAVIVCTTELVRHWTRGAPWATASRARATSWADTSVEPVVEGAAMPRHPFVSIT